MLSPGEERAIHLATEAIELFDAGHREVRFFLHDNVFDCRTNNDSL